MKVIAHARESLCRLIAFALEPTFIEMNKINWETYAGDGTKVSPYVELASDYLRERVPVFRKNIMSGSVFRSDIFDTPAAPDYFQIVCDTILAYFARRYEVALKSCQRIGQAGAQQLATDLAQFNKLLESLPTLQTESTDQNRDAPKSNESIVAPAAYLKKVKREVEILEKTLKVIWTPEETLVSTYKDLLPNHPVFDFVSIMQLKGSKSFLSGHETVPSYLSDTDKFYQDVDRASKGWSTEQEWSALPDVDLPEPPRSSPVVVYAKPAPWQAALWAQLDSGPLQAKQEQDE
jgi:hypothetical protein